MRQPQAWLLATRPKTLLASICPVLLGTVLAWQKAQFQLWIFLFTLTFALLIQIATNLSNDYFDCIRGADTKERKGPIRVTQAGLVSPKTIRLAFILTFLSALLIAIPLALVGGVWIWIFAALSIVLGYLYTGGPYPLAYIGLGDLFVLVFFGPVACVGTYYLQTLQINMETCILGIGLGLISTAILVVNNLRDIEEDRKARKKTLAVRFGKAFSRFEYTACILLAFSISLSQLPWIFWVLVLPIVPFIARLIRSVYQLSGESLNAILGQTAALLLLYTLLSTLRI